MFRVLKQLFTSPFSYFYSEFSGLNQAIAQPSAEDLLATQGMALLSDKYLFIKSKNRQEYVSLQKKNGCCRWIFGRLGACKSMAGFS